MRLKAKRGRAYQRELVKFRARKAKVLEALAQGVSQAEIARKLGVSRQRVCQIVRDRITPTVEQ